MAHTLYSYRDIRVIHLEPTSKCQAACPMCDRNLRGGRTRRNIDLCEITLAEFQDWFAEPLLRQLSAISMCGNFGDPIIARDCLPMLEHARQANRTMHLHVNTNGSARSGAFWRDLAGLGVHVNFAIDGATAESLNTQYFVFVEEAKVGRRIGATYLHYKKRIRDGFQRCKTMSLQAAPLAIPQRSNLTASLTSGRLQSSGILVSIGKHDL